MWVNCCFTICRWNWNYNYIIIIIISDTFIFFIIIHLFCNTWGGFEFSVLFYLVWKQTRSTNKFCYLECKISIYQNLCSETHTLVNTHYGAMSTHAWRLGVWCHAQAHLSYDPSNIVIKPAIVRSQAQFSN